MLCLARVNMIFMFCLAVGIDKRQTVGILLYKVGLNDVRISACFSVQNCCIYATMYVNK